MTTTLTQTGTAISATRTDLPSHALIFYVAITFAITWGIGGTFIFLPEWAEATFGQLSGLHPLYFLATWAPAIAGIGLVFAYGGISGLGAFLSRLTLWRGGLWWLFILLGMPLLYVIGSLIKGGGLIADLPEEGLGVAFLIAGLMFFLGPIEEFGWRGVAQPILQRHVPPFWAAIIIGTVWGVWHLPGFYLAGVIYADWNFPLFLLGCVTLAVLVTPIFNASKGSLLLPMMFHWQAIMPFWPDAQPWDTWFFLGLAAVIVWLKRDTMFARPGPVTRVIPERV
ncbi:MAG: CPBP family intramembrane metalloprotease [Hyphomicrobiaceae bacterium]|nr:CPBP family intramembrane metalloprotease [Hyphomicrobiaceae bacterium]